MRLISYMNLSTVCLDMIILYIDLILLYFYPICLYLDPVYLYFCLMTWISTYNTNNLDSKFGRYRIHYLSTFSYHCYKEYHNVDSKTSIGCWSPQKRSKFTFELIVKVWLFYVSLGVIIKTLKVVAMFLLRLCD